MIDIFTAPEARLEFMSEMVYEKESFPAKPLYGVYKKSCPYCSSEPWPGCKDITHQKVSCKQN